MPKNILCFLTVRPHKLFYRFCKKLKNTNYDVYIVIDDNKYNIPDYDNEIGIIKIDNKICEENGFKSSVWQFNNKACSRDKALYFFCKNDISYDHIWFIEEDVFIPTEYTIEQIDKKYPSGDLLVNDNDIIYERKEKIWHWSHVNNQIKLEPPYARSLICAIRCSKKLLNCINDYAMKYSNLFLDETLFNTIALHNNLDIKKIDELSTIFYRNDWKKTDINVNNLYHPIKCIATQYKYRR